MPRVMEATAVAGLWQRTKSPPTSPPAPGDASAAAAVAGANDAASETRSPPSASNARPPAHAPAVVAKSAARSRINDLMVSAPGSGSEGRRSLRAVADALSRDRRAHRLHEASLH